MHQKLIRLPQVRELVGLRKTAIYDKIKAGAFPKPVKLGRASGLGGIGSAGMDRFADGSKAFRHEGGNCPCDLRS